MSTEPVGYKKLTMNTIASSIIRNSLWFLVTFGILVAAVFPFVEMEIVAAFTFASMYALSVAGISTLIRHNSYAKYYMEYQRYRSYIAQMLLFYKHKRVIYLEDVQVWIDKENQKLKERFLRDASFYLGIPQEEDGSIDLRKFYPQEPKKPKGKIYNEKHELYEAELEKYHEKKAKFKVTWVQKRIIKRIENKDYPKIPWKPSAILNVIGDADFYVNRNVFNTQKVYKRYNTITALLMTTFLLFFAGSIAAKLNPQGWSIAIQVIAALFSIFSSLIFGGIQGSTGGKKEERSLATANGIFKQIKLQELTEVEVEQYIKENQIVTIYDESGEKVEINVDEIVERVAQRFEVVEEEKGGTAK